MENLVKSEDEGGVARRVKTGDTNCPKPIIVQFRCSVMFAVCLPPETSSSTLLPPLACTQYAMDRRLDESFCPFLKDRSRSSMGSSASGEPHHSTPPHEVLQWNKHFLIKVHTYLVIKWGKCYGLQELAQLV